MGRDRGRALMRRWSRRRGSFRLSTPCRNEIAQRSPYLGFEESARFSRVRRSPSGLIGGESETPHAAYHPIGLLLPLARGLFPLRLHVFRSEDLLSRVLVVSTAEEPQVGGGRWAAKSHRLNVIELKSGTGGTARAAIPDERAAPAVPRPYFPHHLRRNRLKIRTRSLASGARPIGRGELAPAQVGMTTH